MYAIAKVFKREAFGTEGSFGAPKGTLKWGFPPLRSEASFGAPYGALKIILKRE